MEQTFLNGLLSERRARLWLKTLAGLALDAPREHWHILFSDLRHGSRILAASPGFTAIALIVIALGIGAAASIFSVVNAVLFRSLPYGHPETLVYLWSPNARFKGAPQEMSPNVPDFYDWQRLSGSFSSMTIFRPTAVNIVRGGFAIRREAAFVSNAFFRTLDVQPQLGKTFDSETNIPVNERIAVISDALWRSVFGSTPDILGKQIQLSRQSYTVVGVMQPDFGYPFEGDVPYEHSEFKMTDIWLPLAYTADQKTNRQTFDSGDVIARLRDGVSSSSAQAELAAIESHLQPLYPEMWRGWTVLVKPLVRTILGPVEKMLWLLLGAVGIVLLISVTNVANLLWARATTRAHELGIRTALGAERRRIIRQMLTESLLLSFLGGILGVALAYASVPFLISLSPGDIPRLDKATVDPQVLLVAVMLSFATGIASGVLPAISSSGASINSLLRQGGSRIVGSSHAGRFALIVTEVALSVVLLAASGLLIRSYHQLVAVDTGFWPATLTFSLHLDERYNKPQLRTDLYKNFLAKLQQTKGVEYAGASSSNPLSNHESVTFAEVRGVGKVNEMVEIRSVTPAYRQALGTHLLRGRDFTLKDAAFKPPVVVVNERFATKYFAGRDPLGGQVRVGIGNFSGASWATVVGVVGDVRHNSLEQKSLPAIFQPADNGDNFAVKCSLPSRQVLDEARAALRRLDPALTFEGVRTMSERVRASNARRVFQMTMMTGFAAIAIALALAGLYGLMSYAVKERTKEIGVRLAIGSSRGRVLGLILWEGLRLTVVGLLIGLTASLALTRAVASWLFGVKPVDPVTFCVVPLFVLLVACFACIVPAWSATRINPIEALRQE